MVEDTAKNYYNLVKPFNLNFMLGCFPMTL